MTDWKAVAQALDLNIPEKDLDRVLGPVAALETAFRPAIASLDAGADMAVVFHPAPEDAR